MLDQYELSGSLITVYHDVLDYQVKFNGSSFDNIQPVFDQTMVAVKENIT